MKKILLIPSPNFLDQHLEPYVPFGLYSLQALSINFDNCVDVFSYSALDICKIFKNSSEFVSCLYESIDFSKYNVIGISTICNSFHHSLRIANQIKSINSKISIWLGGPHASLFPAEILSRFNFIDAVFVGEAEASFSEVLKRRVTGNLNISGIHGICTREKFQPIPNLIPNLDDLPFIYDSPDFISCFLTTGSYKFPRTIPLEASRGCPGRCTFCSTKSFWGGPVRRKSDERMILEMEQLWKITGINQFMFLGDHFGYPKSKLLSFCKKMQVNNHCIEWNCNIKMNQLEIEDLTILWNSGCRGIFIGVESASQSTLDLIKKDVQINKELELILSAIRMGFLIETSFIIGFPWEDEKGINETYNLHCELLSKGVFRSQIWVLCPLPGTELTKKYESDLKWNNLKSRIALDDIQLDKFSSNLIISNQDMFSQFGYIDNNKLDWIEISATADAAYQLNNMYFNEKFNRK